MNNKMLYLLINDTQTKELFTEFFKMILTKKKLNPEDVDLLNKLLMKSPIKGMEKIDLVKNKNNASTIEQMGSELFTKFLMVLRNTFNKYNRSFEQK
jgi:hypothetical protein